MEHIPAEFPEFLLLHRASHRLPFHTRCQISCLNGSLPHSHLDLLLGQALEVSTTQSTHISGLSPCPPVLPHCVTTPCVPSPWAAWVPPPVGLLLRFLFFKTPSNSSTPSRPHYLRPSFARAFHKFQAFPCHITVGILAFFL